MDYLSFYNLRADPFQSDPDLRFYHESEVQRQATLRVMRGLQQRKRLSLLIGEPGCGKTILAQHLLEGLAGDSWAARILVIPHAACPSGWLLHAIAEAFGVSEPSSEPLTALTQLSQALAELESRGTYPVLLVEEAQLLSNKDVLEDIRALLNLPSEGRKLISLVLFGLPSLDEVIRLEPSLAQRVEIRVELGRMDREQSAAYVRHRIGCAGGNTEILNLDALDALYTYSNGVPRVINTLADNALFEGSVEKSPQVSRSHVIATADQLGLESRVAPAPRAEHWLPRASSPRPEAPVPEPKAPPSALAKPPSSKEPRIEAAPPKLAPPSETESAKEADDTLTAISLMDDDSIRGMITGVDEEEAAASKTVPTPNKLNGPANGIDDENVDAWLDTLQHSKEDPAVERLATEDIEPEPSDPEPDTVDTSEKFESLWSEIEPDDSNFPPAASASPGAASKMLVPSRGEAASVAGGIQVGPAAVTTPKSEAEESAEASADEIDALFNEIQLDD